MAIPRPQGNLSLLVSQLHAVWDYLDAFIGGGDAAWASYTPTWTNLTIGNGTVVAKWIKIGKTVHVRISLVFGSTTSITASLPTFTLPVTAASYPNIQPITSLGLGRFYDQSADVTYETIIVAGDVSTGRFQHYVVSGSTITTAAPSATAPFTWTTSDQMAAQFTYEAA